MICRSCIVVKEKKQYNFLFYAKKRLKYLYILRIVLKVIMLYHMYMRTVNGCENTERGRMDAEKI